MLDCGARIGLPTPLGKFSPITLIFSLTVCRALKISVFHSNSTQTIEIPAEDELRTLRTFVAPFTDVSMGNVTSFSTSSGAIPCASVNTTTVGAVRSGNTSTSIFEATKEPNTIITTEATTTSRRLLSEKCIMLFNILESLSFER